MNSPIVSVIIIFFNAERFLAEAIESVRRQTFDSWELLLVDDGSTDGSRDIALECAAEDPTRVVYLHHPGERNLGMSASRNRGLRAARGEYVAFLDADDVWLPAKLADQLRLAAAHPAAEMIYGRSAIWRSWDGSGESDYCMDLGVRPNRLLDPPAALLLLLENRVQTPTTCCALLRRSACIRVGGFEEAFRGMFEDQAFFAKLCLESPVYVADAVWARYRQHDGSCCAVAEAKGGAAVSRKPFLRWFATHLRAQGVTDRRIWTALRAARRREAHAARARRLRQARRAARRLATRLLRARYPSRRPSSPLEVDAS